jgi:PAS domain S-box-containing protein
LQISLKYKFLIPAVALLILGMGTVSVVSHIKSKQALTKTIVDEIENVAQTTVFSMSSWITDRTLDVDNWSKQGVYQKALINSFLGVTARSFANAQLKRIKTDYGYYKEIMLADISGDIVAASDPGLPGKINVSDRVYFQKALTGSTFVTRHVLNSKLDGRQVVMISAPVKDDGEVAGVLYAVFDVKALLGKFIDSIRIGKSGYAFVFLEKGAIICNKAGVPVCGKNINDFRFGSRMVDSQEGTLNINLDGVDMTAAFRNLDKMNWTIVVCAVNDEVFLPVKVLRNINMFVTIFVTLIVCIVIVMVTLSVSRPVKEVVEGLTQMGKGHLDYRLDIRNRDEIGQIGQALNRMAHNLESSDKKIKEQNILLTRARDELEQRVENRTFALKQAEEKYRGIFENAVEGIFQSTLDGRILNANPSMAGILGYRSVDEMFAAQSPPLFPVSRKEAAKIRGILKSKGDIVAYETPVKRRDGVWAWCSLSASSIAGSHGEETHCEGFVIDITERREKESAQREYKAARAANRAKSEFLANMSHEIRTPLNTLLGFSELLAVDLSDPKQESYIEAMRVAGNSLLTLINDILDLSKIEAGKLDFRYEPVNFKVLCSEMRYIYKDKIDKKGIEFVVTISDDLPDIVLLDETRIRQILLNLVGNAVKFTDKGHITLEVKCRHTGKRKLDLVIAVEDTGPGIAPEHCTLIFDSFKQVDGQINRKHGGTGLGLAICRRLTEAMNGTISVKSRLKKGTCFTVILKEVAFGDDIQPDDLKPSKKVGKNAVRFQQHKILIVDDIVSNRIMLKELLLRFNQEVIEAEDGHQAIALAKKYRPDLIVMDIRMPKMDGNAATAILKADPETKNIPIIAFTGDVVAKTKTGTLKKGYDGYLTKPVKIHELTEELNKYFESENVGPMKVAEEITWDHFSKTDVKDLSQFLSELKDGILPLLASFKGSIVINQVKTFSMDLKQLATEHQVKPLRLYADQLIESVDLFDITRIEKKMDELPQFLERLIKILNT